MSAGSLVSVLHCETCAKISQAASAAEATTTQCSSSHVQINIFSLLLAHFLFYPCLIPVFVQVYIAGGLQAAEVQQEAALLLGRLGLSEACKGAIRGHFGIVTLLKMLDRPGVDRSSKEVVVRTLSILAVDNEVNQDHIRCAVAEATVCSCLAAFGA